mgnify:FL=1
MKIEDLIVRRKAARLSQKQIADVLGWSQAKVSSIETEPDIEINGTLADRWLDAIEAAANGTPTA